MFFTRYNYEPSVGEYTEEPSVTVPSQALTIDQILSRSLANKPIPSLLDKLQYTGDEFFPVLETLDFTEREALWEQAQQRIASLEDQLKAENLAASENKKQADLSRLRELQEHLQMQTAAAGKDAGVSTKDA